MQKPINVHLSDRYSFKSSLCKVQIFKKYLAYLAIWTTKISPHNIYHTGGGTRPPSPVTVLNCMSRILNQLKNYWVWHRKNHLVFMKLLNQRGSTDSKTIYFPLHYILHGRYWVVSNTLFEEIRKILSLSNLLV